MEAQPSDENSEGRLVKGEGEELRAGSSSPALTGVRGAFWRNHGTSLGRAALLLVGLCSIALWGRAEEAPSRGAPSRPPVEAGEAPRGMASLPTAVHELPPPSQAAPPCKASGVGDSSAASSKGLVDINTATATELRTLEGVGEKKAAAILALREKLGKFRKVSELLRVKGIGPKMLARWRDRLTVGEPPQKTETGQR